MIAGVDASTAGLAALFESAWWVRVGAASYVLNLAVGLMAQLRLARFGVWHHILYAVVFATAAAAAVFSFHPALLLTLGALSAMPRVRPRSWAHPALAVVGLSGYLLTALPSPW